ncbi:MAG: XTP/dITP diphosphatase [Anaerovoracaceae bacterium]|jgi:XTP/dITP diphosphohydrolase
MKGSGNEITLLAAATGNENKLREIGEITSEFGIRLLSKKEAGAGDVEPEETGTTFEENSLIKAKAVMDAAGIDAIADDSGLVVDALDGAPGVYSARFAGEHASDSENNAKLLNLLENVPDDRRTARFVCVITLCRTDGTVITARGECSGRILRSQRGEGGFGYDPLFVPDGYEETFAELSGEQKNRISHRARALAALKEKISEERK